MGQCPEISYIVRCRIFADLPRIPVDALPDSGLDVTVLADSLTVDQSHIFRLASSCNHISPCCNLDSTTNQLNLTCQQTTYELVFSFAFVSIYLCRQCGTLSTLTQSSLASSSYASAYQFMSQPERSFCRPLSW